MANKPIVYSDLLVQNFQKMSIFSGLSVSDLRTVAEFGTPVHFKMGKTIFHESDILQSVYIIADGKVKIYKQTTDGRFVALDIFNTGDILGDIAVFAGRPCAVAAQAMCSTLLIAFKPENMLTLMSQYPSISVNIIVKIAKRLRTANDAVIDMLSCRVDNRIAKILHLLHKEFGVNLPTSHQDIADMAGTTRETASRALEQMKASGLLDYKKNGELVLLNLTKLQQYQ